MSSTTDGDSSPYHSSLNGEKDLTRFDGDNITKQFKNLEVSHLKEFNDVRSVLPILKRDLSDEVRKAALRPGQENAIIEMVSQK